MGTCQRLPHRARNGSRTKRTMRNGESRDGSHEPVRDPEAQRARVASRRAAVLVRVTSDTGRRLVRVAPLVVRGPGRRHGPGRAAQAGQAKSGRGPEAATCRPGEATASVGERPAPRSLGWLWWVGWWHGAKSRWRGARMPAHARACMHGHRGIPGSISWQPPASLPWQRRASCSPLLRQAGLQPRQASAIRIHGLAGCRHYARACGCKSSGARDMHGRCPTRQAGTA